MKVVTKIQYFPKDDDDDRNGVDVVRSIDDINATGGGCR